MCSYMIDQVENRKCCVNHIVWQKFVRKAYLSKVGRAVKQHLPSDPYEKYSCLDRRRRHPGCLVLLALLVLLLGIIATRS